MALDNTPTRYVNVRNFNVNFWNLIHFLAFIELFFFLQMAKETEYIFTFIGARLMQLYTDLLRQVPRRLRTSMLFE